MAAAAAEAVYIQKPRRCDLAYSLALLISLRLFTFDGGRITRRGYLWRSFFLSSSHVHLMGVGGGGGRCFKDPEPYQRKERSLRACVRACFIYRYKREMSRGVCADILRFDLFTLVAAKENDLPRGCRYLARRSR